MIVVVSLIVLGMLLELLFIATLWPPWRSQYPAMSWLLTLLSSAFFGYDLMILLATLDVSRPVFLALGILVAKDVILAWRIKVALKARKSFHPKMHRKEIKSMNELLQLVPAKVRKYVYASLALLALVYAAWQASDGNWQVALGSLVTTLLGALANANVKPNEPPPQ